MCTVTLLALSSPEGPALRLAFNRDESRRRRQAIPPRHFAAGENNVLMPIDPESTGTWIAVSSAGIALALMNLNPPSKDRLPAHSPSPAPSVSLQSRGTIIPSLLAADSLEEMTRRVGQLPRRNFVPFRLLLASTREVAVFEHIPGNRLRHVVLPLTEPVMFTSSALGDDLVDPPRRELFRMVREHPAAGAQDAFHRHHWPDCPHLSVCMSRSDARTVSHTLIQLTPAHAHMTYFPDSPDQPLHPQTLSLALRQPEPACN